jgi:hypothetical protein
MQTEDLTIDDNLRESDELEKQFLHPGYTWRGLALRPYSYGSYLMFKNILNPNDAPEMFFMQFIFVLLYDREKLKLLCRDKAKFFSEFIDWSDSLGEVTTDDELAAMKIFEEIRGWAQKSSVEVVPDPTLPEKKTAATVRHLSPV